MDFGFRIGFWVKVLGAFMVTEGPDGKTVLYLTDETEGIYRPHTNPKRGLRCQEANYYILG